MGKIINYRVVLYPAQREGGFVTTKFEIGSGKTYPSLAFQADSVQAMLGKVKSFADAHNEGCRASVRCLAPRKPAGFDKATEDLFFHLDKPPLTVTA